MDSHKKKNSYKTIEFQIHILVLVAVTFAVTMQVVALAVEQLQEGGRVPIKASITTNESSTALQLYITDIFQGFKGNFQQITGICLKNLFSHYMCTGAS